MSTLSAAGKIAARFSPTCAALALMLSIGITAHAGPIHKAARKGDKAAVIALLKQNPGLVSSKDSLGNTPLHLAAQYDQPEIAELLLANGADVNAQTASRFDSNFGGHLSCCETPLTLALLSYHHKRVMELLVTHGADVNLASPLSRAIERNLPYDVQFLLVNGANPDAPIWGGGTAVHMAVVKGRLEILKMLLDYGANPNAKDDAGHTPMYYLMDVPYSGAYQESKAPGYDNKIIALLAAHGGHK